jgi:hypothetical protein
MPESGTIIGAKEKKAQEEPSIKLVLQNAVIFSATAQKTELIQGPL